MRQGGAVVREMSSGNQVRVGQCGATSRTCSSSSLSLHSVCASRLTGGNAYMCKVRGQLCASASVLRGPSVRETYSWQWEDSWEANRSTWASSNRLQISRIVSGWSRLSSGNVSCRESASAARLSFPGMWTARGDLNCVWLQRRRWRASCDMRCDRIPPNRLMYETAAVLSVRTNMCLPNSSGRNCRKARCTAHSSRQLMCQSSRGPVQSPEAACPLHLLWQQYAGTLVLGAPQPVERQGLSRGWGSGDTAGWCPLKVYRGAMPTSGPGSVASAENRGVPDCHRRLENAVELGRSPGELNRVAEPNCAREPARQAGQREPHLQTLCKRLQWHNRRTCGGAVKGSRGGWYRRRCVLRHPHRTPWVPNGTG